MKPAAVRAVLALAVRAVQALAVGAVLTLAMGASGAAGQSCGLASGGALRAAGGAVGYDLGDGLTGAAVGGDFEVLLPRANDLELQLGYRLFRFDDGPDPHVFRLTAAYPALGIGGIGVCLMGHGGVSFLPTDQGNVSVFAGGAGLRLSYPTGAAGGTVPYIEVRALGGASLGDLGGLPVDASAQAVGVEAGLSGRLGPAVVRVAGSMDGFASGLGTTPYPWWTGGVSIGFSF